MDMSAVYDQLLKRRDQRCKFLGNLSDYRDKDFVCMTTSLFSISAYLLSESDPEALSTASGPHLMKRKTRRTEHMMKRIRKVSMRMFWRNSLLKSKAARRETSIQI